METSDAETGMVDCGVGTIVWVRRRNGSWWPGKILGPDELSASHLMSPRSGTPVKLLGREDASVDWYNLEKSKRVKPFRCGEFDDCIERAEASQGMPPKKREKYARREDAILHALELEKQLLEKKYGQSSGLSAPKLLGKDKSVTSCDNGSSKMDLSLEEKRKGLSVRVDSGDKSPDLRPRLRGLQDLGVGPNPIPIPIPLKYKVSSSNGSHKHVTVAADGDLTPGSNKSLLEKRKRSQSQSQEGNMEETMNKRRDRRRPLVQVLKSSAKLPPVQAQAHIQPPSLQLQGQGDDGDSLGNDPDPEPDPSMGLKAGDSFETLLPDQVEILTPKFEKSLFDSFPAGAGLSEENNTTGSNEDTETDSSGTESLISDTYDAIAALSDEGEHIEFIPKAFGRSEAQGDDENMSDESGVPDDSGDSAPTTVSKWQLKGKRNSRKYQERKVMNNHNHNHWMSFKEEEEEEEETYDRSQVMGYNCLKGYWEQSPVYVSLPRHTRMLIDVDVQVQSGYQREHVPMISLMSKLNDKAIVGHPLPIETLEDGSSDIILSAAAAAAADDFQLDSSTLQPWRTARRTAKCRVPRLSTLEEHEEEEEQAFEYVIDETAGSMNRKSRKPLKKLQRKSTSSCNQKTRTLSSIGGSHHHHHHHQSLDLKAAECYEGEGVMKPESLPTAVACIPVKLVFSRLHEELVARHQ